MSSDIRNTQLTSSSQLCNKAQIRSRRIPSAAAAVRAEAAALARRRDLRGEWTLQTPPGRGVAATAGPRCGGARHWNSGFGWKRRVGKQASEKRVVSVVRNGRGFGGTMADIARGNDPRSPA
jgi:hypothetical protein